MFAKVAVLLVFGVALAAARLSSQAEHVEQLVRSGVIDSRISNDILEDAHLDVPDLVRKYKYPFEVYNVETPDGYILELHRIPHGLDNHTSSGTRPVVFLMHGLLSSSADWVLMGPGCGLAYILAEEGYDVWMGNARGNYYSRRHRRLRPDALLSTKFWDFSWDEIGDIDLPTMIDFALEKTNKKRLHYIGHSQGTTAFWVMASLNPKYNDKIISMHALAPVAYMAHNKNLLLKVMAHYSRDISGLLKLIGVGEFMPNNQIMTWAGQKFCMDEVNIQAVCSSIMFLVGGWNSVQHNSTMLPVKLGHTPAGASVKQLVHYGQSISDRGFRRYNHGRLTNLRKYGRMSPPRYDLSKITAPVFLHYSDSDPLAEVPDVMRLFRELGRPAGLFRIRDTKFSHLDFMWAIEARPLLYDRVINLIKATNDV
ncbi:hypothetical protein O0L34_g18354 [Tuta absoluta]|nr:hypothetical protein O0L34_g18354 [Tuta absoluta]